MLNRFLSSVRRANKASGLDLYYQALSRNKLPGGPTVDEARKDYIDFIRHQSPRV